MIDVIKSLIDIDPSLAAGMRCQVHAEVWDPAPLPAIQHGDVERIHNRVQELVVLVLSVLRYADDFPQAARSSGCS